MGDMPREVCINHLLDAHAIADERDRLRNAHASLLRELRKARDEYYSGPDAKRVAGMVDFATAVLTILARADTAPPIHGEELIPRRDV